jgi:hypothetical protein
VLRVRGCGLRLPAASPSHIHRYAVGTRIYGPS